MKQLRKVLDEENVFFVAALFAIVIAAGLIFLALNQITMAMGGNQ